MGIGLNNTEVMTLFVAGLALILSMSSIFFELVSNFDKVVNANWEAISYVFLGGIAAIITPIFVFSYSSVLIQPLGEFGALDVIALLSGSTLATIFILPPLVWINSSRPKKKRQLLRWFLSMLAGVLLSIASFSALTAFRLPPQNAVILTTLSLMVPEYIAFGVLIPEGFRLERDRLAKESQTLIDQGLVSGEIDTRDKANP